jgi:protein gp37
MGQKRYADEFKVTLHPEDLETPKRWDKPRRVFVCSMGDLFHRDVPDSFIRQVFATMNACPRHTFQVLTKRPDRMASMQLNWTPNIWAGVTVESAAALHRTWSLARIPAAVRWLSVEPMIGPMPEDLPDWLRSVQWVVCGAESGPGARYMELDWARQVRDATKAVGAAFFLKQLSSQDGGKRKPVMLDGRTWEEYPDGGAK